MRGYRLRGIARCVPFLVCLALSTPLGAQIAADLRTAVGSAARNNPQASFSQPVNSQGQTGNLSFTPARQTIAGLCRSFAISFGAAAGYAGEACLDPHGAVWAVRSVHLTPSTAQAKTIATQAVESMHHDHKPRPVLLQGSAPTGNAHFGQAGAPNVIGAEQVAEAPAPAPSPPPPAPPPPPPVAVAAPQAPYQPPLAASPAPAPNQGGSAPAPAASDTIADLSSAIAKFTEHLPITYNKPDQLHLDQSTPVSLIVASADLKQALTAINQFPGTSTQTTVALSPTVIARLTGDADAVTIKPRVPESQQISNLSNISWIWDVTAQKPGATTLTLEVYDVLPLGGQATPVQVLAYTDTFKIRSDPVSLAKYEIVQISPIWTFLGLGTPVAMITGIVAWRRRQQKPQANQPG